MMKRRLDPRVAARLQAIDEQARQAVHEREMWAARKAESRLRKFQTYLLMVVAAMLLSDQR